MFRGTWKLTRLALRRDRVRIPVWILIITSITVIMASSLPDIYQSSADRQARAALVVNPAAKIFAGPGYGVEDYTLGAMLANEAFGFLAIFIGLMSILLLIRHTRAEENSGTAELVQSSVVGRYAPLAAALILVTSVNILIGIVTAISLGGLGVEGMSWQGSWLYGLAYIGVGLSFMSIAAVTAQIFEQSRSASGVAGALLATAYVLRGVGDAGNGSLSWLSPFGWVQSTKMYVEDRWWPLAIVAVFASLCLILAFVLSRHRDVGGGFVEARSGRGQARKGLLSVGGLARRLQRVALGWWIVGMTAFGLLYGSLVSEVENFIKDVSFAQQLINSIQGADLIDSFLSMIVAMLATVCGIYALLAALKLKAEEDGGRAETLLSTPTSRLKWAVSHLGFSMIGGAILVSVVSSALALSVSLSAGNFDKFADIVVAGIVYIPAIWVASCCVIFLFGLKPSWTGLSWIVVIYGLAVSILGNFLSLPEWINNLSPFRHVPKMPAQSFEILPIIILLGVGAVLAISGLALLRRRNIMTT